MRVWIGGVETLVPARWFFCAPGAPAFPSPHGAEAGPWLRDNEVNEEWGEVSGPKILDKGVNPGYQGLCHLGADQWFIDGELPANVLAGPTPAIPLCCQLVPCSPWSEAGYHQPLFAPYVWFQFIEGPAGLTSVPPLKIFNAGAGLYHNPISTNFGNVVDAVIIFDALEDRCGEYPVLQIFNFIGCVTTNNDPRTVGGYLQPDSVSQSPFEIIWRNIPLSRPPATDLLLHPCPVGTCSCRIWI
jgi:hypothetical protein